MQTQSTGSPIIVVLVVVIIFAVIGFSLYIKRKQKAASWQGTILDKAVNENVAANTNTNTANQSGVSVNGFKLGGNGFNNSTITHDYSITVRSDVTGKTFNWPVSSGQYEQLSIGDIVKKSPGIVPLELIQRAAVQPQPPVGTL